MSAHAFVEGRNVFDDANSLSPILDSLASSWPPQYIETIRATKSLVLMPSVRRVGKNLPAFLSQSYKSVSYTHLTLPTTPYV